MKKYLYLSLITLLCSTTACNYNRYTPDSPYRGTIAYEHPDETVVRPKKTRTMTVKRDLTYTSGGTVHTRTVNESVTIPEDISDADDFKKAQRAIDADTNYLEIDINQNKSIQRR